MALTMSPVVIQRHQAMLLKDMQRANLEEDDASSTYLNITYSRSVQDLASKLGEDAKCISIDPKLWQEFSHMMPGAFECEWSYKQVKNWIAQRKAS